MIDAIKGWLFLEMLDWQAYEAIGWQWMFLALHSYT